MNLKFILQQTCYSLFLISLSLSLKAEENNTWHCQKNAAGIFNCTGTNTPIPKPSTQPLINTRHFNHAIALDKGIYCDQTQKATDFNTQLTAEKTTAEADSVEYNRIQNTAHLKGHVEINQNNQQLLAQDVIYDISNQKATLKQPLFYQNKAFRATAQQGEINLKNHQGEFKEINYRLIKEHARGTAQSAQLKGKQLAEFKNLTYSTCPPNKDDWVLSAKKLQIDQKEGVGIAHSAKLKFKGVPVFYSPYLSFPIDDRRKTGILLPKIGYSSRRGFDFALPYYLNLAANYDLTLTPRIMSERGLMLGGEFRYLNKNNHFNLRGEVLAKDKKYLEGDQQRSAFSFNSQSRLLDNLTLTTLYHYLSDKDYLSDMGNSLTAIATQHVERRADLKYSMNDWSLLLRAQKYQTLDQAIAAKDRPYSRLPQLLFLYDKLLGQSGFDFAFKTEYVRFDHSSANKRTAKRFDLHPRLSYTLGNAGYFITPALSARYTKYQINQQFLGLDDSPDRTSGTFSLDSGLFFDRKTTWFGQSFNQTIEPRLYYLYTPDYDHQDIPLFDSSEKDFRFDTLFTENRFNGTDRVGDANQLTFALQSRFIADQGQEVFRLGLGTIRYFANRKVSLNSSAPPSLNEKDTSSIIGDLSTQLSQHWRFNLGAEWNPYLNNELQRSYAHLNYRDTDKYLFNFAYRQNRNLQNQNTNNSEQLDLSIKWAINTNYSLIARSLYALDNGIFIDNGIAVDRDHLIEGVIGLQYENCCWGTQIVLRDTLLNTRNIRDRSFFIQFEFKGLGRIGHDISELIERNVYGFKYRE